ncbi:hypothetical protein WJX75_004649 [Coccomyxa subellipsoidea]|uniref:Amine oxidase domain-containing protein n=1 Tax=Coccomyxa subellipsoidea TaxID=248742 RepID=A0ABR2YDT4_9CHLO
MRFRPSTAEPQRPDGGIDTPPQPDLVDKFLSQELMGSHDQRQERIKAAMGRFQRFPGDTGSSEVQVAILTEKIYAMAEHMKIHRKDFSSRNVPSAPPGAATDPDATHSQPSTSGRDCSHSTDYVIIGSGIGGLCCAALLAKYGYRVTVCESHYHAGGAAHSFEVQGYHFDAGPSFFAGLSGKAGGSPNPLKQVLDAVGESVECAIYDRWVTYTPEAKFQTVCNAERYAATILEQGGPEALAQWRSLEREMAPLQQGAATFPAAALRSDFGVLLTMLRFFGPSLAKTGLVAPKLTAPFSKIVDRVVTNAWLRRFLDLECFVLSGMLAKDTICAEMAFMLMERNRAGSTIDYPLQGSRGIVDALVRGIEKNGGRVMLRARVEDILLEGGKAVGVRLAKRGSRQQGHEVIRAARAVISNASVWDTQRLLPTGAAPDSWRKQAMNTPQTGSFVHLHLGINAEGLPANLDCHHLIVNSWEDLEAPQNVCIGSIPTVFNPRLAPPGKALVHAYTAGNEPYSVWEGKDRNSDEYRQLKEDRSQVLWRALERAIPDVRERAELVLVGTPLTHERFLNRHRGTYGAAISAASGSFPGPQTPIPGLYRCGDSCAPGIGVPAAAASGMITANTLAPVHKHLQLLSALGL